MRDTGRETGGTRYEWYVLKNNPFGGYFLVGLFLHLVDGFDEVEESFGALVLVGDFGGSVVSWFQNCVVAKILEDVAIHVELL